MDKRRPTYSIGSIMLLVALIAGALRLFNPPKNSATTTIDLSSEVGRGASPEQNIFLMQSPFVIHSALRDLKSDPQIRDVEVRLDGWSHRYTRNRGQWIQSHLTAQLIESDNGMWATLTLTSTEGTEDDLHVILQAIHRAYLDELDEAEQAQELKRRRESERGWLRELQKANREHKRDSTP